MSKKYIKTEIIDRVNKLNSKADSSYSEFEIRCMTYCKKEGWSRAEQDSAISYVSIYSCEGWNEQAANDKNQMYVPFHVADFTNVKEGILFFRLRLAYEQQQRAKSK